MIDPNMAELGKLMFREDVNVKEIAGTVHNAHAMGLTLDELDDCAVSALYRLKMSQNKLNPCNPQDQEAILDLEIMLDHWRAWLNIIQELRDEIDIRND